jgi:hypothetical protein
MLSRALLLFFYPLNKETASFINVDIGSSWGQTFSQSLHSVHLTALPFIFK